ncbi:MAG: hypothetical protein WD751_10790 [Anaerolineales bacterium]
MTAIPDPKHASSAGDFIALYTALEKLGIDIWLDGGWGVDALLGKQTRPHEDIDIVIQQQDLPKLREHLAREDYTDRPRDDTSPWNFVLGDGAGRLIDVHAIVFDEEGNGLYGPVEQGVMYPAESLTGIGEIGGHTVRCISAAWLVKFHSGYTLCENDYRDVSALCEKFSLPLPEAFADFAK